MLISEIRKQVQQLRRQFRFWWGGLQEVWQPGYSLEYREYRLREAFGLLPSEEKTNEQ